MKKNYKYCIAMNYSYEYREKSAMQFMYTPVAPISKTIQDIYL